MAIKPTGHKAPVQPGNSVAEPQSGRAGASFGSVAAAGTSPATSAPSGAEGVKSAVRGVAADIEAGRVSAEAAIDAVIERLVEAQMQGAEPGAISSRVTEAQAVLGANPTFIDQVGRIFGDAGVDLSDSVQ